jgi:hypothetical protein
MTNGSFTRLAAKNSPAFPVQEPGKSGQIWRDFLKTGLTKRQKTTAIFFDEAGSTIEVQTHNTDLKNRLRDYAAKYPALCQQTDDDGQGGLTFEIDKKRFSFRLTAPYSAERRQAASRYAKEHGIQTGGNEYF